MIGHIRHVQGNLQEKKHPEREREKNPIFLAIYFPTGCIHPPLSETFSTTTTTTA